MQATKNFRLLMTPERKRMLKYLAARERCSQARIVSELVLAKYNAVQALPAGIDGVIHITPGPAQPENAIAQLEAVVQSAQRIADQLRASGAQQQAEQDEPAA